MKEKSINKLLFFSFFIFILAIIFFIYFIYSRSSPQSSLQVNIDGPKEVLSLENYNYKIEVKNKSNKKITDVIVKLTLPDGIFFTNNPQSKETSLSIGDLEANQSASRDLNIFFVNSGELTESLKFIINYKIENKDYIFAKENKFDILVKNSPLKIQISMPTKTYVNQEFQSNFQILNLSKQKLENLKIKIEAPGGYILSSSSPQSENLYWEFNNLDPGNLQTISLQGRIQDPKSSGIFTVKADFSFQNLSFSLTKEIAKIQVLSNSVVFYIKSTPANKSVKIGSSLFYDITIENKSNTTLENNEVKISFNDLFDFSSLNSDGYFNEFDKTLYFNSRNKPKLLTFQPNDKLNLRFSISLIDSYPILGENKKDFTAKIKIEFKSSSTVEDIEENNQPYISFYEDERKIIGNFNIESELVYNDPNFENIGTLPLEANKPTSLGWHINIKTIGEDFDNFTITTKLPIGVNFTGKVAQDAILDNVKFDPKTGAFVYTLNKLPANLGYLDKEINLAFQLTVEMPANVSYGSFTIVPKTEFSGIGAFSQSEVRKTVSDLKTYRIISQ